MPVFGSFWAYLLPKLLIYACFLFNFGLFITKIAHFLHMRTDLIVGAMFSRELVNIIWHETVVFHGSMKSVTTGLFLFFFFKQKTAYEM